MSGIRLLKLLVSATLFFAAYVVAQEQEHDHEHEHENEYQQHSAHVHGHAKLFVAVDGNALEIMLESPAMNLLGFEHEPESPEQLAAVDKALSDLNNPQALFAISEQADCVLSEKEIEAPYQEKASHHDHDHDNHDAKAQTHSDYLARYRFACRNPEQIKLISVHFFKRFPMTESIEVQTISTAGQKMYELTSGHDKIAL